MSNHKNDSTRKTPSRKRNPNARVKGDGSDTPEIKAKVVIPNDNPKGAGRKRDWKHTHTLSQDDLSSISIFAPLSIKQEKYLNDEQNDIVVWGGSAAAGKTQLSLLKVMLGAFFDKHYTAGIARRSQRQMKQAGSLWSEGTKMYTPYGVGSNRVDMQWNFPNGAEVKCHHLDGNQDDWQGSQLLKILVDEAQQCKEDDVWYLTSRLRSKSSGKPQLLLTCNPLNTSFLCEWLMKAGYVGEDGLPVKEMDGVSTFMVQIGGRFEWFKTRKEVEEAYGETTAKFALSFVFYSANVYDNPWIRRFQPDYVNKLENLKEVERQRLLLGNWLAKPEGTGFVTKEQFNTINLSEIPLDTPRVRAWDLAGTKPHPANKDPDWTRGILGTLDKETGNFYIMGCKSLRDNSAVVQGAIEQCVIDDGSNTYVCIPVDSGAAGKTVADQKRARLMSLGAKVVLEPTRQSKLVRAEALLMAIQEGKVFIAPNVFSDADFAEIEAFDGDKCGGMHDDLVDAMASCYNTLISNNLIPTIRISREQMIRTNFGGSTLL